MNIFVRDNLHASCGNVDAMPPTGLTAALSEHIAFKSDQINATMNSLHASGERVVNLTSHLFDLSFEHALTIISSATIF